MIIVCCIRSVVGVLMDFLNGDGAMDVILFVRSIVEQYEVKTAPLVQCLMQMKCVPSINKARPY